MNEDENVLCFSGAQGQSRLLAVSPYTYLKGWLLSRGKQEEMKSLTRLRTACIPWSRKSVLMCWLLSQKYLEHKRYQSSVRSQSEPGYLVTMSQSSG